MALGCGAYLRQEDAKNGMANIKSAIKRIRRTKRQTAVNVNNRSAMRTTVKKLRTALDEGSAEEAEKLLPSTVSALDRSVQKGIMKKNTASRLKSRLSTRVNKLKADAA